MVPVGEDRVLQIIAWLRSSCVRGGSLFLFECCCFEFVCVQMNDVIVYR